MVLIWPVENLPRLSLTADGKDDGDRMQMIIVGWMDEDESSTAVIGAIISYSKPHKNLNKEVTSAIELLAEYHPCRTRQSDNDECGECSDCTTYQSLRVIAAFEEHIGAQKINAEKKHNEIIIYNPREANAWNIQYNQFRRQNNKAVGVLQRNLVRMSKSSAVFEELKLVLTDKTKNQLQQRIHNNSAVSIPPDYNTEPKCNTIVEENPDCFGKQSLLLLHWNTAAVDPTSDTFFFDRIPLFRALKLIWKERRCSTSSAALSLDFMLGLLIGFYLVKYPATILQQIGHMMAYHDQLFNENLQWLESFPAGFKLNVALTHRIGKEVRWILFYHKRLYSSIAAATATIFGDTISVEHIATTLLQNIGLCTALFGSRFCFAMAFDMTRLALLHIHLLSEVFATCLRFEMSALKSFWLLFTGKKRNVLRQRSDHLHYDHMQLLLGMILFSTCLFVFTTVLVYNWFFAVTNFGTEMIFCGILWFLHTSVEGGVQCERIILRRRWSRSNGIWTGKEVQFAPASLPESIRKMDTSYLMRFYDDKGSESKEIQSSLLPSNVSVEYQESCVLKIVFPSESDFSIVTAAMVSSISLVISRLPTTIVKRLLFGSPCNLAHSFIDFSNLLIKAKR